MSLTDREIDVLSSIIESYIQTAVPVGSRTVARQTNLGLSPASIRNVMADLTDQGYLEQPHASAGRVPTPKAFRFYLNRILRLSPLPENERHFILTQLGVTGPEITDTLRQAGRLLSSMSRQVSMVLAPLYAGVRLKRVEFVLIKPRLVLVVLILAGGVIQKKLIDLDEPVRTDDLVSYANYLNEKFVDLTVAEIKARIITELKGTREMLSSRFGQALMLVQQAFEAGDEPRVYVEGTTNILTQPEFATLRSIRDLIQALEDKSKLLSILDKVMDSKGVLITLGDEGALTQLPELSLIASPYTVMGQTLGVIGVIGPMRMDYASLVPVVDYTAQTLAKILRDRF